jgi:hypothetical protein
MYRAGGEVVPRAAEDIRCRPYVARRDSVRDVDQLTAWRRREQDAAQLSDIGVAQPEIGEKRDQRTPRLPGQNRLASENGEREGASRQLFLESFGDNLQRQRGRRLGLRGEDRTSGVGQLRESGL